MDSMDIKRSTLADTTQAQPQPINLPPTHGLVQFDILLFLLLLSIGTSLKIPPPPPNAQVPIGIVGETVTALATTSLDLDVKMIADLLEWIDEHSAPSSSLDAIIG